MSAVPAIMLPTRRVEEWKYSDLNAALGEAGFGAEAAKAAFGVLPEGVEFFDLDEPNRPDWVKAHYGKLHQTSVSAVSLALAKGGVALRVPKNKAIDRPVTLTFSGKGHVRALIVLEEGASLTLAEKLDGKDTRNAGVEIAVGPNAQLNHVRLSPSSVGIVQVEEVAMTLARDAQYNAHYASFGAKLSRLELEIALNGAGAQAHLSGVSVLADDTHADITTRVTHAVAHTQSTQLFKKVAGGKSRAVYQGKVTVAKGADQSDSRQTAKAILLGNRAEADLKPELEIFADDVKCAHGAAVGDLDADSLFYLRARGLPENEARSLLLHAFLEEAVDTIARDDLRDEIRAAVNAALDRGNGMTAQAKITRMFDVNAVRNDFPILIRPVHGKPLVYLDSGASAQKPRAVLDAMNEFARTDYANVHRGVHYLSGAATDAYEESRRTLQRFLNAAREDEIIFTKGGTEAINLVSYSFLAPRIQPGDEIVLSVMEHHSNIVPWHFLRERQGAVLRWVDVRDDGSLDIEALDVAIGPKTKLVAITHMSNVLGTVTPLKDIVARAHAKGVPVLADGCQGAVHETVDVQALDIDFYAVTGHKLYGPTGIGALYAKRAHLKAMRPFNGGGEMIREVTREKITYADPPARFEAGTPPIIEAVGLSAALNYITSFDRAAIRAHEHDLYAYARTRVGEFNWLRVIGDAPGKGAILSFEADGMHAHDLATILDREGIAVRAGHHCAQILMERFGVMSTSRASFGMYNTRSDVDALAAGLQKAREILG